jgi:hypothetical protein
MESAAPANQVIRGVFSYLAQLQQDRQDEQRGPAPEAWSAQTEAPATDRGYTLPTAIWGSTYADAPLRRRTILRWRVRLQGGEMTAKRLRDSSKLLFLGGSFSGMVQN